MSVGPITGSSGIYAGIPGLDALGLSAPTSSTPATSSSGIVGFGALGLNGNGSFNTAPTGSVTAATGATGQNVYQQAYDSIIAASNNYLQSAITNGAPQTLPQYAAGSSAEQFALLQTTLSAISVGLQSGQFQGTGFNSLA